MVSTFRHYSFDIYMVRVIMVSAQACNVTLLYSTLRSSALNCAVPYPYCSVRRTLKTGSQQGTLTPAQPHTLLSLLPRRGGDAPIFLPLRACQGSTVGLRCAAPAPAPATDTGSCYTVLYTITRTRTGCPLHFIVPSDNLCTCRCWGWGEAATAPSLPGQSKLAFFGAPPSRLVSLARLAERQT